MLKNLDNFNIILGSHSPRRRSLLKELGLTFTDTSADIDETIPSHIQNEVAAEYLALEKSKAIEIGDNDLLITADTTVVLGEAILNKPADFAEAKRMLRQLSGQTHRVISGVAVRTNEKTKSFSDTTSVTFHELSDGLIEHYVANFSPLDKAGAYGIQEWFGMVAVKEISGSYFNVMGLPTDRLWKVLEGF